ncbi:MAG: archaeosortase H N-terminal-like domain-containing protein [Promethearchaeota archaeon]
MKYNYYLYNNALKTSIMKQLTLRKIFIWVMLTINLLFAFVIGLTIPMLGIMSYFYLGLVIIPLLIILNYIIIDRFHYYLKHTNEREENTDAKI